MLIFDHVLNDMAFALKKFNASVFFELFIGKLKILAQFGDELAMSSIIVFRSYIIFDEDVYLDIGMHR